MPDANGGHPKTHEQAMPDANGGHPKTHEQAMPDANGGHPKTQEETALEKLFAFADKILSR